MAKMGRPSKYKPEYCETVEERLREGWSVNELCREFRVCAETFRQWMDKYPDFLTSVKKGLTWSEGWWEMQGRENIKNKDFNSALWFMNMRNRFGWTNTVKEDDSATQPMDVEIA